MVRTFTYPEQVQCQLCLKSFGAGFFKSYHQTDEHYQCTCGRWLLNLPVHIAAKKRSYPHEEHHATGKKAIAWRPGT